MRGTEREAETHTGRGRSRLLAGSMIWGSVLGPGNLDDGLSHPGTLPIYIFFFILLRFYLFMRETGGGVGGGAET